MDADTRGTEGEEPEPVAPPPPDSRFWVEFGGAYGALLAATRDDEGRRADERARGTVKIRRRDAVILADGIAGLLQLLQEARDDARDDAREPPP